MHHPRITLILLIGFVATSAHASEQSRPCDTCDKLMSHSSMEPLQDAIEPSEAGSLRLHDAFVLPDSLYRPLNAMHVHPHAKRSLVFGILSILTLTVYPLSLVLGLLAMVFAGKALRQIRAKGSIFRGEGMATVGRVLGFIAFALTALIIVAALASVVLFF